MRARPLFLLPLGAALSCSGTSGELTIEFSSQDGVLATTELAVTAFVPLLTPVDSDIPNFVEGENVGVFPPTRIIDPETIQTFSNLGQVLEFRKNEPYPLNGDDWGLDVPSPDTGDPNNPWGAVMLYIEARGEARTPDEKGSQSTATLLAGWECVRTEEASHGDQKLDKAVKKACRLLGEPLDEPRVISLGPVAPPEFALEPCDGVGTLSGAKNQSLSPGPAVCLSTIRCDNVASQSVECFECMQPCSELDDLSNVPIVFSIDQPGGNAEPKTQVVLTDGDGRAQAPLTLDACQTDIVVRAQVLGRTTAPVEFELECVDPISEFECIDDVVLPDNMQPQSVSTIPGVPGGCNISQPETCDQVAVLRDDGDRSRLEIWHPNRLTPITRDFPEQTAVAVHGFHYELGPDGRTPSRPAVAVALAGIEINGSDDNGLRIYVFELVGDELVPHDGMNGTGLLNTQCTGWFCGGSQEACTAGTCAMGQSCYEGICVSDESSMCAAPAPAGCSCEVDGIKFQSRATFVTRDLDGDRKSDLTVATDESVIFLFHRTATSSAGEMFDTAQCECGRFAQAPNAFGLGTFGGAAPDPLLGDIYIGATGGSYLKYAEAFGGRSILKCGNPSPLGDGMSVRDVVVGKYGCRLDDPACQAYDDVVTVAAKNITGGGPEDPGVVRMIIGSSEDLTSGQDPLERPGVRVDLLPRTFVDQTEPRDPQRAEPGDYNGDGHLDLAVLYRASGEVHLWLGASNHALGETDAGVLVDECPAKREPMCTPMSEFARGDYDGDGSDELAIICNAAGSPTLRFFDPVINR